MSDTPGASGRGDASSSDGGASERRFTQLAEAMPQLVWTADEAGIVDYYNSRTEEYDGIERHPDGSWAWAPVLHEDDLAATAAAWQRAVEARQPYAFEHRVRMRDGSYRWHLSRAVPVHDDRGLRWFGTATDIHTLKTTEQALRESEERYRTLFESIDEGFCLLEMLFDEDDRCVDYRFLEANAMFARHTGLVDAVGRTARELVPDLDESWFRVYGDVALTGRSVRFENYAPAMNRWFDVYATRAGAPERRHVALVFHDITERKRAEEALREADRHKNEFLAVLAHELRNPLAPVRNAVHILRRGNADGRTREKVQDIIDRQVTHMARLIDDLLDVSRIARGRVELRRARHDLVELVGQTVEDYRASLEGGGLRLSLAAPHAPVTVDGDGTRLAQIVGNLLHNASKFTAPGGRVHVRIERDDATADALVIVDDDGIGMSRELIACLFDPFRQGTQDLSRSKGGLGLGLALAKGLAELHGGTLEAESGGPGRGSRFTLRVPTADAYRLEPDEGAGVGDSGPLSVVIVEDNADAAETLRLLLSADGHAVHVASDGASGIALTRAVRPDVVICDIGLPGETDGYDVARALREEPSLSRTLLVALSGYSQDEDRQRARQAGFSAHLAKPPDLVVLAGLLSTATSAPPDGHIECKPFGGGSTRN